MHCFLGTQTEPSICNVGTQTNSTGAAQGPPSQAPPACHFTDDPWKHLDEDHVDEADCALDEGHDMQFSKDPPFCPEEWDMDESDDETSAPCPPPKPEQIYEPKFLVFDSCLRELLDRCLVCGAPECKVKLDFVGTMVRAEVTCPLSHSRTWRSQPVLNRKPMGNISVCSAILFSGSSPTKVLRLFSFMGMQ